MADRFSGFLYRHRVALFAIWLGHAFLIHYFVLGYMSGDGLSYRVVPVIELLQHGDLGKWKYPTDWTLRGYVPFVELAHLPFLAVFGLRGLIIGFPLVVFPLCVAAVFLLIRELTSDPRAAMVGAVTYVAMPMINQQAFGGLVDFAVAGILAFWLYALLRLRAERSWRTWVRIVIATVMLSLARQHGVYLAIALLPIVLYACFGSRDGFRIKIASWGAIARAVAAFLVGALPAVGLQIYRGLTYGSPLAPSELKLLGVKLADGAPLSSYLIDAGIQGDSVGALARGFLDGWVWHVDWPMGAFYHSQFMGAGFLFLLALIVLPVVLRHATPLERWVLFGLIAISVMARDFALPRWCYGLTIAVPIVVGRGMSLLAGARRGRPVFWAGAAILILQLLRPELDILQLRTGAWISPRINVGESPLFVRGDADLRAYPDGGHQLAIVETTGRLYTAHLFGLGLTNEVVGTIRLTALGERCAGIAPILAAHPDVVFVDDFDHTKACDRTCVIPTRSRCWGFRIRLP
ncbi:MAG: hypothetical protein WKG01_26720 [Kofleriaceae bacterium]